MSTSNKTIKARVQVKADTDANWNTYGSSVVPLLREPIFYTTSGRIKLGDGTNSVNKLPFFLDARTEVFITTTEPTAAKTGDIWVDVT